MEKTPATILQEYCVKQHLTPPFYEYQPEEMVNDTKVFPCTVTACSRTGKGRGRNKKDAKHAAAVDLLKQLGLRVAYANSDDDEPPENQNCILQLLDICVARNLPLAEFREIQATGPSHCPVFTIRCQIATIAREGTAPSKKAAKQKAAKAMLETIQEICHDPDAMQLITMKEANQEVEDTQERVIRTYRELKKSDFKKQPGVKLADRHNFFKELPEKDSALAQLDDYSETLSERVHLALRALKLKFEIQEIPSNGSCPLKTFELVNEDYDCYFVAPEDSFWSELDSYLRCMMT